MKNILVTGGAGFIGSNFINSILNERDDIIVMVDEAHRTQYWKLAANMRKVLPNARYIAFTGTPLLKGDKIPKNIQELTHHIESIVY